MIRHLHIKERSDCEISISNRLADTEWDAFVFNAPGGHYAQTCRWALAEKTRGWRTMRIIMKKQGVIIAGTQLLFKPLAVVGYAGQIDRGPIVDGLEAEQLSLLMQEIQRVRKQQHIVYQILKPPLHGEAVAKLLPGLGYRDASDLHGDVASLCIDLSQDIDTICAKMTKDKRKTIHRVERRQALLVREGGREDISSFYRLHTASSQRIGYRPYCEEFYHSLWDIFAPAGTLKFFLAEHEGSPVSALLAISFKDTLIALKIGWSGACSNLYPNDSVYWAAIRWAKDNGYHFFDFGGIDGETARAAARHEELPGWALHSYNKFKLDYGARIYFYPPTFDDVNVPLINLGYRTFYPWIKRIRDVQSPN